MLLEIKKELLPHRAKLVAVSKTKPTSAIMNLYDQGHRIFGENRAGELAEKAADLPKDIEWHMIGHLQSKKVKIIAPVVKMIHSVDSIKLLLEIEKQGLKFDRTIEVLIQIKIAQEESKYGLQNQHEIDTFFEEVSRLTLTKVQISGLMGMASYVDNQDQILNEFGGLRTHFEQIKAKYFADLDTFRELSMGMSGDYKLALEAGSTMVRIGSLLFGARTY